MGSDTRPSDVIEHGCRSATAGWLLKNDGRGPSGSTVTSLTFYLFTCAVLQLILNVGSPLQGLPGTADNHP